ncbi:MAG: restriction endonuclease subunit S [Candidatus Cloacimonetes bacterium]|nr:restriction endonuclease subunit S [Candidatus Cloacimonadota bacterium]
MQQELKTEQKEEYKETELGLLPESWIVENFTQCINKKRIKLGKVKKQEYQEIGKFPIVDQGQKLIAGYCDNEEDVYKGELPIIIFGDHTRIIKFIDFSFVCGADGTKVIVPDLSKLSTSFFYYALSNIEIPSRGYNRHYSLLKEKKIPLPPLPEQKKIAFILSTIQDAIEKTENVINSFKELKKSMMKHLFTYGPVSLEQAEKTKLKKTEIGYMPKEWDIKNFEKCINKKIIKVGKIKQQEYKGVGKYPIVDQGQNLIAGYWDNEKDVYQGDLPIIIFGDHTRIVKFIDFPFVCGADGTKIIVPNLEVIDSKFFHYALKNTEIPSRGYNRHYSLLKEKRLPIPSISVQKEIASIIYSIDEKKEKEENKKNALEELFKSMLHNLMTAKIRVNHLNFEEQ